MSGDASVSVMHQIAPDSSEGEIGMHSMRLSGAAELTSLRVVSGTFSSPTQMSPTVGLSMSLAAGSFTSMFRRRGPRDSLLSQRELILALSADVDRQMTSTEVASAAMSTRAAVLVAAAGFTSGVQLSTDSSLPALFTALSAIVGVMLLLMRTAPEVPIAEAEAQFWTAGPVTSIRNLMYWKLDILHERERSLLRRRRLLILGFTLLTASIGAELAIALITSLQGGE